MTAVTMSHKELGRIQILIDLADGRIGVAEAGALMGLGRRQVYRVLTSFQCCVAAGSAPARWRASKPREFPISTHRSPDLGRIYLLPVCHF
jgi:hypothetical protein